MKYISQIDNTVGAGATTIADMQASGPTYGVGIGTNLDNLGIVTASEYYGDGSNLTNLSVVTGYANTAGIATVAEGLSTTASVNTSGIITATGGFIGTASTTPIVISLVDDQLTFTAAGIGSTTLTLY